MSERGRREGGGGGGGGAQTRAEFARERCRLFGAAGWREAVHILDAVAIMGMAYCCMQQWRDTFTETANYFLPSWSAKLTKEEKRVSHAMLWYNFAKSGVLLGFLLLPCVLFTYSISQH